MISVVVADDQELVRDGFGAILSMEDGLEVVALAADGLEAVRIAERLRPDVVLMDIRMPGLDGIAATRRLMALPHPPRVLVLTTFDLDEYVFDALKAGASGFLLKDAPRGRLAEAVRTVAAGETLLDPAVTRRLVERHVNPVTDPSRIAALTAREKDVLRAIAQGWSNSTIALNLFISEATVKTHVAAILRKSALRDRAQAVVLAYESGLVEPGAGS